MNTIQETRTEFFRRHQVDVPGLLREIVGRWESPQPNSPAPGNVDDRKIIEDVAGYVGELETELTELRKG